MVSDTAGELRNRVAAIRASGMFADSEYDLRHEAALRKQDPVVHYLTSGEARGARPSLRFDPGYYMRKYRLGGDSPLLHYIMFGRKMDLRTLPAVTEFDVIETGFREGHRRVLLLAPDQGNEETTQATARLLRALRSSVDVILLSPTPRPLSTAYEDLTACVASPPAGLANDCMKDVVEASALIAEIAAHFEPTAALCCSPRAQQLVVCLAARFLPTLTVVLADVTSPGERKYYHVYRNSAGVVFPSEQVRANHKACYPWLASRRTAVAPGLTSEAPHIQDPAAALLAMMDDATALLAVWAEKYQKVASKKLQPTKVWQHVFRPEQYKLRLRENCFVGGLASGGAPDFPLPRLLMGFDARRYAAARGTTGGNPVIDYLMEGHFENFLRPVIGPPSAPVELTGLRVALHGHYHYTDIAGELFEALAVNRHRIDLYLSTDNMAKAEELSALAGRHGMSADIRVLPNKGRDLGPLLTGFRDVFDAGYDVVGHVHGKKSPQVDSSYGMRWRQYLMEHTVGGQHAMADAVISAFSQDPRLGLVFPEDEKFRGWDATLESAQNLARRMKIEQRLNCSSFDFPAGSFFWCRPGALRPLLDMRLDWHHYPKEPIPPDGTILHAIERLFPFVCEEADYRYGTTHLPEQSR